MKKLLLTSPRRIIDGLSKDLFIFVTGIYCLFSFFVKICYLPIAYLIRLWHYINAKTGFVWKFWRAIGYKNKRYKTNKLSDINEKVKETKPKHFGIKVPHNVYKILIDYINWVNK